MKKPIHFTHHAEVKLLLLRQHGFKMTKRDIAAILREPMRICLGYSGRKVAENHITNEYILRVIFEESPSELRVITMYPARGDRYESKL